MNHKIFVMLIALPYTAFARQDCLGNSWHLEQEFDNKEYHAVAECPCPCRETLENRNLCVRCRHYHEAEPWVFLSQEQLNAGETTPPSQYQKLDPREAISDLIARFKTGAK